MPVYIPIHPHPYSSHNTIPNLKINPYLHSLLYPSLLFPTLYPKSQHHFQLQIFIPFPFLNQSPPSIPTPSIPYYFIPSLYYYPKPHYTSHASSRTNPQPSLPSKVRHQAEDTHLQSPTVTHTTAATRDISSVPLLPSALSSLPCPPCALG